MGAVPECYKALVLLDGVSYEEVQYDEYIGYKFYPAPNFQIKFLSDGEIKIINEVIQHFKDYSTNKLLIECMRKRLIKTGCNQLISYECAESLSI